MEDVTDMRYFDRAGNPITGVLEWARLLEDRDYQRIASDTVGDVHVSTVWLGIDHSFGDPVPLSFETMIFGGDHDGEQWRYPTEEAARAGHDQAMALVQDGGAASA